jgi:WD40 repeat protein
VNGMIGIWGVKGDKIAVFKAHDKYIYRAIFSPDNQKVLTCSADHSVRLWNLDGTLAASLTYHHDPVFHAEYSPNGQHIMTSSTGGEVCIWDSEGRLITSLPGSDMHTEHATFNPDNQSVMAVSGRFIYQISSSKAKKTRSFDHGTQVVGMNISGDGLSLLTWGYDASVNVWDLDPASYYPGEIQGHRLMEIDLNDGTDLTLAKFSPDSRYVYVGMADGMIQIVPMPRVTIEAISGHLFTIPDEYLDRHNISLKPD